MIGICIEVMKKQNMEDNVTCPAASEHGGDCKPRPISGQNPEKPALIEIFPAEIFCPEMRPTDAEAAKNEKYHDSEKSIGERPVK